MSTLEAYENVLLALCLWREARGESREAKIGVKHVILNRAAKGLKVSEVILRPYQFSSFNANDPNATLMPKSSDPSWQECCEVVDAKTVDPTEGSNHYYSEPIKKRPIWAENRPALAQIGAFRFFKL